jgi:anaerobic nitric oxide reductase transcription regulator
MTVPAPVPAARSIAPVPPANVRDEPNALDFETRSASMRRVLATAARLAPCDVTILITGEPGAGKERLARWIHARSSRADRPFVPINCRIFPDLLVDRYVFEQPRGPFSGVVRGIFDVAHGGTLFFDEIGELSLAAQAKLVRVIDEWWAEEAGPAGNGRRPRTDVRIIAATSRDFREELALGRLRADLFYSLGWGGDLQIPPLRERRADLWVLANALLDRSAARLDGSHIRIGPDAWAWLYFYGWPENVRELARVIEYACARAKGRQIRVEDLPAVVLNGSALSQSPPPAVDTRRDRGRRSVSQRHEAQLEEALRRHQGNCRLAAAELGILQATLARKLRGGGWG